MQIGIISLFPEMFRIITDYGIIGRAIKNNLLDIKIWNPRDFTYDKYHAIDDRPYGGGSGMLMMAQPLLEAIEMAKFSMGEDTKVIYLSPQGSQLNQASINKLITDKKLILVCGRYKGIDERVIQIKIDEEWSVGDYVLSGGELPAMILIDSISRFIPRVLGNKDSIMEDSFANGLLDCPHYTRPKTLKGIEVPSVLISGNHIDIYRWRLEQSLGRTWLRRPKLLENLVLTDEQIRLLTKFKSKYTYNNINITNNNTLS